MRKIFVKTVTVIMFVVLIFSACAFDSASSLPTWTLLISGGWLVLFAIANINFKDFIEEDF